MAYLMKGNGYKEKDKDLVSKYGLMGLNMSDNGKIIKPTVKEPYIMQMEISMKDNGLMIKHVGKEPILMKTEPNTLDNGRMISKTDTVYSNGSMDKFMRENTKTVPKQVKVS